MDFVFPILNLRSAFYYSSGLFYFALLIFVLNWIIKIIKHDDR